MGQENRSDRLFNVLTILMLVGVLCVGSWFLMVYSNPQSFVNPFSPVILPPSSTPTLTPTATLNLLAPTFTPQPTSTPEPTRPPNPTATPLPTFTPFSIVTPPTEEVTPTATPVYAFEPLDDHPLAIQNVTHQDLGCSWMGIGGQVLDSNGAPLVGLVVKLSGTLAGEVIDMLTLTGSAAQFGYGPSGYEFVLADEPVPSSSELYIQLLDQAGGPLSDRIVFNTFADCSRNLILISFVEKG